MALKCYMQNVNYVLQPCENSPKHYCEKKIFKTLMQSNLIAIFTNANP